MGKGYELRKTVRQMDALDEKKAQLARLEHEIKQDLVKIQAACPHVWQFIPDASGGNDSENWCDICGKVED